MSTFDMVGSYTEKMNEFIKEGDLIMGHLVDGIESAGEVLAGGVTFEQLELVSKTMTAMAMAWAEVAGQVVGMMEKI